jgi:polysaccharide biosynthesis protein PelG
MAGIGFQLQKMFQEESYTSRTKAYAFTILLTSGPWLITILTLSILQWGMLKYGAPVKAKELFVVSVSYTFIFSQVIFLTIQLFSSRYIADLFYENRVEDVFSASIGLAKLTTGVATVLWVPFALLTPISLWYDWVVLLLFLIMNLIWVLFLFSTATKEYRNIVYAFAAGGVVTVLLFWLLPVEKWVAELSPLHGAATMLGIFIVGMAITLFWLLYTLMISFPEKNIRHQWSFLTYALKYPELVLSGLFYSLGLWVSNWLIWFGEGSILLEGTFRYHPDFDTAIFWSFLTIIPSMMIFVISIETRFYKKYWTFYGYINEGGSLTQIEQSKKIMIRVLKEEVLRLIRTQGLITLLILIILPRLVTWREWQSPFFSLMPMTLIAVFASSLVLTFSLLHLYYDNRKGALLTTTLFFVGSAGLTYLFLPLGPNWFGVGLAIGSLLSFLYSGLNLISYVKEADFHIFMKKDPRYYPNKLEQVLQKIHKGLEK